MTSERVLGADYSGAAAPATRSGFRGDPRRRADDSRCYRGTDEWGRDREAAHAGLLDRTDDDVGTVGLDFPSSATALLDAHAAEPDGFVGRLRAVAAH